MSKIDEIMYDYIISPVQNLCTMIVENIRLLYYFNKHKCYFHFDSDFMYALIYWKLQRMKATMAKDTFDENIEETCSEINEAIKQLEIFYNPNLIIKEPEFVKEEDDYLEKSDDFFVAYRHIIDNRTDEQEEELKVYRDAYYKQQNKAWNRFHELLRDNSQSWWT